MLKADGTPRVFGRIGPHIVHRHVALIQDSRGSVTADFTFHGSRRYPSEIVMAWELENPSLEEGIELVAFRVLSSQFQRKHMISYGEFYLADFEAQRLTGSRVLRFRKEWSTKNRTAREWQCRV